MLKELTKRRPFFIEFLKISLWPLVRFLFQFKADGRENIVKNKALYVSNHNVGALLESHSTLFLIQEALGESSTIFGFTHPSLFKIPVIKEYFEYIGAVPATYEVAQEVFKNNNSLMIFPGGNKQALRSIWNYKNNSFSESHGWAKIAITNNVPVVPITFKGSHFVNPILFGGEWFSKILILPWLLGLKWASFSIGQVLLSVITYFSLKYFGCPLWLNIIFTYYVFNISPLACIIPYPVTMKIHAPIYPNEMSNQYELEKRVEKIMDNIYS